MSLDHAILAFLTHDAYSGYDLQKLFEVTTAHFWPTTQSQIYRTLSRLEERGWVEHQVIEQEDRPDRKVYHLVEDRQQELVDWLSQPVEAAPRRLPWLLQLFFANELSTAALQMLLIQRTDRLHEELAQLTRKSTEGPPPTIDRDKTSRRLHLWQLTIEYSISQLEWEIGWLEDAARSLRDLPVE